MWYLDCYCWGSIAGRDFPVNSYYCECLDFLLTGASRLLDSGTSGIDEVRVSKQSKGVSPIRYQIPISGVRSPSRKG